MLIWVADRIHLIWLTLRALASWCLLETKARSVEFIELIKGILLVDSIVLDGILNPDIVLPILGQCHVTVQLLIILFPGRIDIWPIDLAAVPFLLVGRTSKTTLGSLWPSIIRRKNILNRLRAHLQADLADAALATRVM